jgi:hypothetical protein
VIAALVLFRADRARFWRAFWGGFTAGYARAAMAAIVVVALCGLVSCLSGCTAADQQKAHGAFVDVLGILKWGCRAVGAVDSVHESIAPTSGGEDEEPHTIDGEDPQ